MIALLNLASRIPDPEYWATWLQETRVSLACQVIFCLALEKLSRNLSRAGEIGRNHEELVRGKTAGAKLLIDTFFGPDESATQNHFSRVSEEGGYMVSLPIIVIIVPFTARRGEPGRPDAPCRSALPLTSPLFQHIPLPDGEQIGVGKGTARSMSAFGLAPSWPLWLKSNIEAAVNDITSGEWIGYAAPTKILWAVSPFHNIHFVAEQDKDSPGGWLLAAKDCFDINGLPCQLSGSIARDGRFALVMEVTRV